MPSPSSRPICTSYQLVITRERRIRTKTSVPLQKMLTSTFVQLDRQASSEIIPRESPRDDRPRASSRIARLAQEETLFDGRTLAHFLSLVLYEHAEAGEKRTVPKKNIDSYLHRSLLTVTRSSAQIRSSRPHVFPRDDSPNDGVFR